MLASSAYYYIDDVRVIPKFAPKDPEVPPVFVGDVPAFNTTYVLENIQFEFNSYALIPVSYIDLDRVLDFLIVHSQVSVTLTGHTDDVGNVEYNDALSKNRAKSAAAYLISKGISEERISTFGYGEQRPLISEQTEEARQVNRRVEIRFHE